MNWRNYSTLINAEHYSSDLLCKGSMAGLLLDKGVIDSACEKNHLWYPRGRKNSDDVNGYRYVDMNHSYVGEESILVSEASCCVLVVLIDVESQLKFCAHISASSDTKRQLWVCTQANLTLFFKGVDWDMSRTVLYLFSENLYWNIDGSFEQENVMRLFSALLPQKKMEALAASTYLIQGEDGVQWNPFCSVRLKKSREKQALKISFVTVK